MEDYFTRSRALLGEEKFDIFQNMKFCVIGLGGVGGTAFEALVRTGAKNIVGIDFDKVSPSNLNRQLLYTRKDIGNYKSNCAFVRAKSINEFCNVETLRIKIDEDSLSYLDHYDFDFVIDAIDDIDAKILLCKYFLNRNIPFVSSLGMGNRIACDKVIITKLNKTHDDPLARKFRYLLKNEGVDLSKINVIFNESPRLENEVDYVTSVITSPSAAGLAVVSYILNNI